MNKEIYIPAQWPAQEQDPPVGTEPVVVVGDDPPLTRFKFFAREVINLSPMERSVLKLVT